MSESNSIRFNSLWKDIPGYEGIYKISRNGTVRSLDRFVKSKSKLGKVFEVMMVGRKLKWTQWKGKKYFSVCLCDVNGNEKRLHVGRLVLEAFVGPCPEGMQCCHNDGDPSNNKLGNLRWDTLKNNQKDRVKHGTMPYGENNPAARMTWEIVEECRRRYYIGKEPQYVLAREFGVSANALSQAINGITWKGK